jgi:hypothetical protein
MKKPLRDQAEDQQATNGKFTLDKFKSQKAREYG